MAVSQNEAFRLGIASDKVVLEFQVTDQLPYGFRKSRALWARLKQVSISPDRGYHATGSLRSFQNDGADSQTPQTKRGGQAGNPGANDDRFVAAAHSM